MLSPMDPLPIAATDDERTGRYAEVLGVIDSLLEGEDDWIAAMATVSCELHGAFAYYDWTGFYRAVAPDLLVVGPYQGSHGCLRIPFDRGVCGAAARTRKTQCVVDVHAFAGHIACSASTRSEIVVPIITPTDRLLAVLDVDSNAAAAFRDPDRRGLEALCRELGRRFAHVTQP
jgi:L-methionine (R)-S-oxide reductase